MTTPKPRRNTPQRRMILHELCQMKTHPTAAELYAAVRLRLPRISLGTVYRNLDVLHEDGLIRKMEFAGAETRFDGILDPHDHVRCTECGRIEDIYSLNTGLTPEPPAELAGFQVTGHRLEFFGLCPGCRMRGSSTGPPENPAH